MKHIIRVFTLSFLLFVLTGFSADRTYASTNLEDGTSTVPKMYFSNITEWTEYDYVGLADCLYENHLHYKSAVKNVTLKLANLTKDDMSKGLYYYQYNIRDPRIKEAIGSDGYSVNTAAPVDLKHILIELFKSPKAYNTFVNDPYDFVKVSNGLVEMNNTGDFGAAGYMYFDIETVSKKTKGNRIILKGNVMEWKSSINNYKKAGKYIIKFRKSGGKYGVHRFISLKVRKNK